MKRLFYTLASLILIISIVACGDTSTVGNGILSEEVKILVDSNFVVTGHSTPNVVIPSKTTTQLLGVIDAKEYGRFTSDFVTQFMPAATIDTTGILINNIDSLKLMMAIPNGSIVGDSVIPMGLEVYLLNKQLPSPGALTDPITSAFNPEGYFDPTPIADTIYNCSAIGESDSIASLEYRFVYVKLPVEIGRNLYQAYLDNPASYNSPEAFTNVFKGIYVKNSFGSGRVARIASSIMRLYWHTDTVGYLGTDSIIPAYGNYYAVTPEIITNNNITYNMSQSLQSRIDQGEAIISAPTGSDVEITFPAQDLINVYNKNAGPIAMINDLTLSIPAIEIDNNYSINPPPCLLMVLSNNREEFFRNNDLPDNETSFYALYNASTHSYTFTGMRDYALWLLAKENITPEDYTFTLSPVTLNYGTNNSGYYGSTTYLESVSPYVQEPAMVQMDVNNSKIIFTYSRQYQK